MNHRWVRLVRLAILFYKKRRFDCSRENTLHNIFQIPSTESYTKGSIRMPGSNTDLEIDSLIHIRVNNFLALLLDI